MFNISSALRALRAYLPVAAINIHSVYPKGPMTRVLGKCVIWSEQLNDM